MWFVNNFNTEPLDISLCLCLFCIRTQTEEKVFQQALDIFFVVLVRRTYNRLCRSYKGVGWGGGLGLGLGMGEGGDYYQGCYAIIKESKLIFS